MTQPITLSSPRHSKGLGTAGPDPRRRSSWLPRILRPGVIAAFTVIIAAVVLGVSYLGGRHLVTAWWFENLRGQILWQIDETNWRQGGATSVSFGSRNSQILDGDLKSLPNLLRVVSLDLAEADGITNDGLVALRDLRSLTELNLDRLNRYRYAGVGSNSVPLTDACLPYVLSLPGLEDLSLSGDLITDRGLAQIATMANLKVLDLTATEVSDAGLAYLEGMKSLVTVRLGLTRVTNQGLAHLQSTRPELLVELETDPMVEEGVKLVRGSSNEKRQ